MTAQCIDIQPDELAIDIIRSLLNEMTDEPANIKIESLPVGMIAKQIAITSNRTDYGNILGASKSFLVAFQSICRVISKEHGVDLQLQLRPEIPTGEKRKRKRIEIRNDWPKEKVEALFQKVFDALFSGKSKVVISTLENTTAVEVVVAESENPHTVEWIGQKLRPVVVAICARNSRPEASLNVIQDDMLYAHAVGQ